MKIKLSIFAFVALSVSAHGFAQSTPVNRELVKTAPSSTIDSQDMKHGPLVDFYELVGQYQFAKKESVKEAQQVNADAPKPHQIQIADAKLLVVQKP